jgi:hypothetical protein
VVRPVLTSAETLSAIGIDQDRDGCRGVRLTAEPSRPESAFQSTRFHGAEPGHKSILVILDAMQPRETTKQSSMASQRKTGRQNPRLCRSVDTGWGMPAADSLGANSGVESDEC